MRPKYEISDVINNFYDDAFRVRIPIHHQRTLEALQSCRTVALGWHLDSCDECGFLKISYNSCRNRNCPKCQGLHKEMWVLQRQEELLPVAYFHVVFTLPHELNGLCLHNPRFMYDLLFEAAWHVLKSFGEDPQWLGAQSAATMILHTWGQNLRLHPHVHCIVPNGGIRTDGTWQNPRKGNSKFLYPIKAMNKVYKAFFLKKMRASLEEGLLSLPKDFPSPKNYYDWKENLYKKNWVVYAKPPFGGVDNVVNYLARYSHKIAISNHRILNVDKEKVTFRYRDYADKGKEKVTSLKGKHFLQLFCLHILPDRFRKVRHFGFLSNGVKNKRLTQAKKSLSNIKHIALSRTERKALAKYQLFGRQNPLCPCCNKGEMETIARFKKNKDPPLGILLSLFSLNCVF